MITLLDVNLLVALAWPNHLHHELARRWFTTAQPEGWATCPLTESGFVRVSSNPKVIPAAVPVADALRVLEQLAALRGHVFWTDDISIARSPHVVREALVGYRQITDAHLLAVALSHQGRLATLDRAVTHLAPVERRDAGVVVVPT